MKKLSILLSALILVVPLLFMGCSANQIQPQKNGGLQINSLSTAISAVNETNTDEQKFSYSFSLTNEDKTDVYIKSVEPIINDSIKSRIQGDSISTDVNRDLQPNSTIQVTGELILNTKGLSKSDIIGLQPFANGIKISSEESIPVKF
jgi:hypothetical protein